MFRDQWSEKIVSPVSGQKLYYRTAGNALESEDRTEVFPLINGVPELLSTAVELVSSKAEAHEKLGTVFQYREHYEKDAEVFDYFLAYEDGASRHESRRLQETITREVPKKADSILDVGCGSAWVARRFCPQGKEVFSLDIARANPIKALERYPFPNHYPLIADVYALPFPSDTFDCIIGSEIIEHLADPALFIEKLMDVLRPGGKLIITTPFEEKIVYSLCIHCNLPTSQHAHLHSFSKDGLARMVRRDQVADLEMKTFSNKALTKLQTHIVFKYFPWSIWRLADWLSNAIVQKPARLMMTLCKR